MNNYELQVVQQQLTLLKSFIKINFPYLNESVWKKTF